MTQKVAFIINPKAGVKKKINVEEFISANFSKSIPFDLIVWKNKDDFDSIKQRVLNDGYTIAVACGGDGTVNQVAAVLSGTNIALGILPLGSGNGLARSNKIPMDLLKALKVIEHARTHKIDVGSINNTPFFCTAGVGFDALIATKFATSSKRGFATYVKTTVREYFGYKPHSYTVQIDGKTFKTRAFLITVANAGQWGNNVYIAPHASMNDGLLHVTVLKPFTKMALPLIVTRLMARKINTSPKFKSYDGKKIEISFHGELPAHFDGEPMTAKGHISIEIKPLALNVVC